MTDTKNYVAAWADYRTDKIIVLERDSSGALFKKRYNPPYYFYVPSEDGEYTSMFGDKLARAEFDSREQYEYAKRHFPQKFESDINPLKRVLMDYYYGKPTPTVYTAFLDIEVDYRAKTSEPTTVIKIRETQQPGINSASNGVEEITVNELRSLPVTSLHGYEVWDEMTDNWVSAEISRHLYTGPAGFSSPTNPYAAINAVTVYQSWSNKFLTAVIPPKGWAGDTKTILAAFHELIEKNELRSGILPEIHICADEYELLLKMMRWIEPADILSGWNSEFFDIPYICERLLLAGGESLLAKIDHLGVRLPKKEMVSRFGTDEPIWKLTGRSHLDYMRLFQKFTFEGRVSYALGNILQEELGLGKLEYESSLEQLYNKDFPHFVAYNFRDVDGLVQLDEKFKFIALANQMAHENTVLFSSVLGTVDYVETGITNHAHNALNVIVRDKNIKEYDKVEGAIVLTPKIGLHEFIGSVDIASLYPNTIRSLNISPEKIIGQFTAKEQAWADIKAGNQNRHTLIFENGKQEVNTAEEWRLTLMGEQWALSAYGTVFDQSSGNGIIPDILKYWYTERKRLQGEKKKYGKLAKEEKDPTKKAEYQRLEEEFDLLQLTKKISMNSLYGALLNSAFRFGDERMGASVTATGRQITTHMMEEISEQLTGERTPLRKTTATKKDGKIEHIYTSDSPVVIYGDTDSCYYKCMGATDIESAIEIADLTAQNVNSSFPAFMRKAFLCQSGFDTLISAAREVVGVRGIFQAKKKYMIKVVDLEGVRVDKLKSQGSEIKKADTPKVIQQFLKNTVDMILDGIDYDQVATFVNEQRSALLKKQMNVFSLGVAKQVNNLDKFLAEYLCPGTLKSESGRAVAVPGHVRAALNYNVMIDHFDKGSKPISSGDKVLIYYLKKNQFGFTSIGIPAEQMRFPDWFLDNFKVDKVKTEAAMFDSKLSGIFSAIGKDVPSPQSVHANSILGF